MSSKPKNLQLDPTKLLLIDIETTCWDGPTPEGQTRDIIEIGWAKIDLPRRTLLDNGSILVRPHRSKVSTFCTDLTSITKDVLFAKDGGAMEFRDACGYIRNELQGQTHPWGSWGMFDIDVFREHCDSLDVQWPFGSQHLNVKAMYQTLFGFEDFWGMGAAVENTVGGFAGRPHRGGDDAFNLARVTLWLSTIFRIGVNHQAISAIALREMEDYAATL